MTKRYLTVVGDPIIHSLSPLIHSLAYDFLGLDWIYDKNLVSQGGLRTFVEEHSHYSALSVTMPLKDEAFELSDSRSEDAIRTQVVNTLVKSENGWQGYNTDVFGIRQALRIAITEDITSVSILGAGATARSAVLAVSQQYPDCSINVFARNLKKAESVGAITKVGCSFHLLGDSEYQSELVINTTPVDLTPNQSADAYLLNTAYIGNKTAIQDGVINGLEMLLWQAIAQIRIFISGDQYAKLEKEDQLVLEIRKALHLP